MRLFCTVLLMLGCLWQSAWALDANISFATFKSSAQNYVELYLHVTGSTLTADSTAASGVQVVVLFKQGKELIQVDKYNLYAPKGERIADFVDLKRYGLPNGQYALEVLVTDLNATENTQRYTSIVDVAFSDALEQSDIQLLANMEKAPTADHPFAKHGYLLEPLPYLFYRKEMDQLWFYNEIYAAATPNETEWTIRYYIDNEAKHSDEPIKIGNRRRKAKSLVPLLLGMDIKDLPSGNYKLVIEVRNESNELLSQKSVAFQRSNPYRNVSENEATMAVLIEEEVFVNKLDREQLDYSLKALLPKVTGTTSELFHAAIKQEKLEGKRLLLLNYWLEYHPNRPEVPYEQYMSVVDAVSRTFQSGFRKGFQTDRGNLYLKYGRPDDIVRVEDEPSAPPYEIWVYNDFPQTNQTNVRFLFYNPSLAGGDFVLLHSTARGEINNRQWEVELYRDNAGNEIEGDDPFAATRMKDNFGRRARRYFNDF